MKNILIINSRNIRVRFIAIIAIALMLSISNCTKSTSNNIPVTTKSAKALEYYNEGLGLAEKFRQQEAVYFYLKALAEDDEFAMAYLQMVQMQTVPKQRLKYFNKAITFIDKVSEGERLYLLAAQAGINNDREKENNYYLELLDNYPNDEHAHTAYAEFLFFQAQNYKTAIKHYEKALKINPEFSQPYNMLGYSYRRLGDLNKAEIYFKQYIDIIQDDPNPYDSYAELLLKKGEFDESIEYYRKALDLQPNFISSILGIASNLMVQNKPVEAINELANIEALSNDPGELKRMHIAKAVINVDSGNFDEAIDELKMNISISKEIKDNISLGNDLVNLGDVHLMSGKLGGALKYYEKSMEYFERSNISQDLKYYIRRQLFTNAGHIAYFKKDVELLRENLEKYQSSAKNTMNPDEIRNLHELNGLAHILEENYFDTIAELKQANQENPIILYLIGTAYEELGDVKKAQEIYQTVAHFNSITDLNYAFIRKTALAKLGDLN